MYIVSDETIKRDNLESMMIRLGLNDIEIRDILRIYDRGAKQVKFIN